MKMFRYLKRGLRDSFKSVFRNFSLSFASISCITITLLVVAIAVILSYIQKEKEPKPSIVVCPSSLSLNWQNEINKFAPEIKGLVIRGNSSERRAQIKSIPIYNIVITSYDLLKRDI